MMRARFLIEDPDKVDATVMITMPIGHWVKLHDQLVTIWPSSDLARVITDVVTQAHKAFYASEQEPKP